MDINKKLKIIYCILLFYLAIYLVEPFLFLVFIPFIVSSKINLSSKIKKWHYIFISVCILLIFIDFYNNTLLSNTVLSEEKNKSIQVFNFNKQNLLDKSLPFNENLDYYYLQNKENTDCENVLTFIFNTNNIYHNLNNLYKDNKCINITILVINKTIEKGLVKEIASDGILSNITFFDNDDFNILYFDNNKEVSSKLIFILTKDNPFSINKLIKFKNYYLVNIKRGEGGFYEF